MSIIRTFIDVLARDYISAGSYLPPGKWDGEGILHYNEGAAGASLIFQAYRQAQHQQRLHTTTRTEYNAERASERCHLRRGAITTSSFDARICAHFSN